MIGDGYPVAVDARLVLPTALELQTTVVVRSAPVFREGGLRGRREAFPLQLGAQHALESLADLIPGTETPGLLLAQAYRPARQAFGADRRTLLVGEDRIEVRARLASFSYRRLNEPKTLAALADLFHGALRQRVREHQATIERPYWSRP